MQIVVLFLMVLVCFNFMLKQTYRKWYSVLSVSVVSALFVGLMWPYAVEQSKMQIGSWLADSDLMQDIAVILFFDVLMQISFCMVSANVMNSGKLGRFAVGFYRFMRWFPGIMIFPVLFCLLVAAEFGFPGVSFSLIAWCLAAAVLVAIPLLTWLIRLVMPEKEIRLELLFMTSVLTAVLGIISTVNGRTNVAGTNEADWLAFAELLGIIAVTALAGFFLYRRKMYKKLNRKN